MIAHDGTTNYLDRQRQVAHHLAHDGDLLVVLLPEVGPTRSADREELGHDARHAVEVSGATRALEQVADAVNRHGRRRRLGVVGPHLFERGLDQAVNAVLESEAVVDFGGTRIVP